MRAAGMNCYACFFWYELRTHIHIIVYGSKFARDSVGVLGLCEAGDWLDWVGLDFYGVWPPLEAKKALFQLLSMCRRRRKVGEDGRKDGAD